MTYGLTTHVGPPVGPGTREAWLNQGLEFSDDTLLIASWLYSEIEPIRCALSPNWWPKDSENFEVGPSLRAVWPPCASNFTPSNFVSSRKFTTPATASVP